MKRSIQNLSNGKLSRLHLEQQQLKQQLNPVQQQALEKHQAKQSLKQRQNLRQQQQQLVADSEKAKEEYSVEKDEAVGWVVPEMEKAKAVPKDEQKPLGEDVKTMAKGQAERNAKRRAKK